MTGNHLERLEAFANHWQAAMDDDLVSDVIAVIDGRPLRKSDLRAALNDVEQLQAARIPLMTLRQAWRNGWTDRGNAIRQTVEDAKRQRDAYERAFVRYMSEDPAEDDKDPYRPLDGPADPAFEQQPAQDGGAQ